MVKDLRCFLALEIDDKNTIHNIVKLQEQLGKAISPVKMVEPENIHLTVRFLGNISEPMASKIYKFIEEKINNEFFSKSPIKFEVAGLGDFGKKVFFVKLNGPTEILKQIKKNVETELVEKLHFEPDRKFEVHITLGRLKRSRGRNRTPPKINHEEYNRLKQDYSNENVLGTINFKRLYLKKSTLTPKGPIYENLEF